MISIETYRAIQKHFSSTAKSEFYIIPTKGEFVELLR